MSEPRFCLRCAAPLARKEAEGRERLVCSAGCGFIHYDNPLPVVAAIVEHEGKVILVSQHGWPDKWMGLVTGFLEKGETPEQGILRELEEELGLRGEVISLVGVYSFAQRNELIIAYHVRAEGEPKLGEELRSFKHIAIDKLQPWPFGTGHAVKDWLTRQRG